MSTPGHWTIRSASDEDKQTLETFLKDAEWKHQHLDWLEPRDLIGQEPFLIAFSQERPLACLACPPGSEKNPWIRIFAVAKDQDPKEAWKILWSEAWSKLRAQEVNQVSALMLSLWFEPLLQESGYEEVNAVIFLEWTQQKPPAVPQDTGTLRGVRATDLDDIIDIDRRAFRGMWRNSREEIIAAFARSAISTLVEHQGIPVAYQMSTSSMWGAHLARLAVDPTWQGKGFGRALVSDLLQQASKRGFHRITVNTTEDNIRSFRLYKGLGFHTTGDRYPVMQIIGNDSG